MEGVISTCNPGMRCVVAEESKNMSSLVRRRDLRANLVIVAVAHCCVLHSASCVGVNLGSRTLLLSSLFSRMLFLQS